MSATKAFTSATEPVCPVCLAVPTLSEHPMEAASVRLVSPTSAIPAQDVLRVPFGAQLPTNASSSVVKTQPTVQVPAHVSATQASDFSQDHAVSAPTDISSLKDTA